MKHKHDAAAIDVESLRENLRQQNLNWVAAAEHPGVSSSRIYELYESSDLAGALLSSALGHEATTRHTQLILRDASHDGPTGTAS